MTSFSQRAVFGFDRRRITIKIDGTDSAIAIGTTVCVAAPAQPRNAANVRLPEVIPRKQASGASARFRVHTAETMDSANGTTMVGDTGIGRERGIRGS
ncbi:MAG: hypothetical protein Fues2KO_33120 [Fuerstiella sp.]